MKGPSAMLWNYDVSDKEEAERMASLYGEDGTRVVEPGTETETGRNLVRRCGNELGIATWEAYDFDPDTWTCETFSNREAAELWLSGSLYLDECVELDRQLTQYFRMRATEGIDMRTVAQEIAKTVPEAKPAEEEPTQTRGPKL